MHASLLQDQTLKEQIAERAIDSASFTLSYIKKLCLHPHLLASTTLHRKKDMGITSHNAL